MSDSGPSNKGRRHMLAAALSAGAAAPAMASLLTATSSGTNLAGNLLAQPKQLFQDANLNPLVGGKIFTYAAGTLTPKTTYQDAALTIVNTNPALANAHGEALIFGAGAYRIILKDAAGNTIYDVDNMESPKSLVDSLREDLFKSSGASKVGTAPAVPGAATRTQQNLNDERFRALDYFMAGEGDSTMMLARAFNVANGRPVYLPSGNIWTISKSMDDVSSATEFRLIGEGDTVSTHDTVNFEAYNSSSDYSPASLNDIVARSKRMTVIHCVGCCMFGDVDDVNNGLFRASQKLKQFDNIFLYGSAGAKIGIHVFPTDLVVRNSTIALFEWFNICTRGGVTSTFSNLALVDGGWNLPESGAIGIPSNYGSGCQFKIGGNMTPGQYHNIANSQGGTTFTFADIFMNVRGHMCNTMSGLRGFQGHGLLSGTFNRVGGYTGNYFNVCTHTMMGNHMENYSRAGLIKGDRTPYCVLAVDCGIAHEGVHAYMTPFATPEPFKSLGTGANGLPNNNINLRGGRLVAQAPVLSKFRKTVLVTTPGVLTTYTLPKLLSAADGFCGMVSVTLTKVDNYSIYSRAVGAGGWHQAGTSAYAEATTMLHAFDSSASPGYKKTITKAIIEADGSISVQVSWGPLWSSANAFELVIGLVGGGASGLL